MTNYLGVPNLNWEISYYIILSGSPGPPKCITNVDVMPNNTIIMFHRFRVAVVTAVIFTKNVKVTVFTVVI